MSILELEELTEIPDTLQYCPVKLAELMEVSLEPGERVYPSRRWWQYRVCGIDQVIREGR